MNDDGPRDDEEWMQSAKRDANIADMLEIPFFNSMINYHWFKKFKLIKDDELINLIIR